MHINLKSAAIACAVLASTAQSGMVGSGYFYASNTSGVMYRVDAQTLAATQVGVFDDGGALNDMEYEGNGRFLLNRLGDIARYDLNSGSTDSLFGMMGDFPSGTLVRASGLARNLSGGYYFAIDALSVDGSTRIGAQTNPSLDGYTSVGPIPPASGFWFDFWALGGNEYLGADFTRSEIHRFDAITGDVSEIFHVEGDPSGDGIVAFFELNNELRYMTKDGRVYGFDPTNGDNPFYGQISGISGNMIGASIPAPGSFGLLVMSGLVGARRRR